MYLIGIDLQFGVGAGGHPFPRSLHLVKFELSKESKQGLNGKDVFLGEISSEKRLYQGPLCFGLASSFLRPSASFWAGDGLCCMHFK